MPHDLEAEAEVELEGWVIVLSDEEHSSARQGQGDLHELASDALPVKVRPYAYSEYVYNVLVYPG